MTTIRDLLVRQKDQIKMALPKHMDTDRLIRVALTSIRQSPKLLECDQLSLLKAVIQSAQIGLEPDGLLGQAYLVPYGRECQLIIGYKGLMLLARRSDMLNSIEAHVVYAKDEFSYSFGLRAHLDHIPADAEDRGPVRAAWALAQFKGGGYQFEVMTLSELEAIRKTSKMGNTGAWLNNRPEMYRKTVLRRLCKFLPLSVQVQRHVAREDALDAGMGVTEDGEVIDTTFSAAPTRTEALAAAIGVDAHTEELEPDAGMNG